MSPNFIPIILVVAVLGTISGFATAGPTAKLRRSPSTTDTTKLKWSPCVANATISCATLSVPVDWAAKEGPQISIGIARLEAKNHSEKIGSLFWNPGGPGGSASADIFAAAKGSGLFTDALRERFDIIGMDPRGVALSTPNVKCNDTIGSQRFDFFPTTAAGFDTFLSSVKALGKSCGELTGPLISHLDTVSQARDMEAVRVALGGEELSYLGVSAGSNLGQTYAFLFPRNIRAMVIDGIEDHSFSSAAQVATIGAGIEDEFHRFVAWCQGDANCPLNAAGPDVLAIIQGLINSADTKPIASLTGDNFRELLSTTLATPNGTDVSPSWLIVSGILAAALSGNETVLSSLVPQLTMIPPPFYAPLAMLCSDFQAPFSGDPSAAASLLRLGKTVSPVLHGKGNAFKLTMACMGWPFGIPNPPSAQFVSGTSRILVVQGTHDPNTPLVQAFGVRNQIENSSLVLRDGDGHTSWTQPGQGETKSAIEKYLVDLTTPNDGTVFGS